MMKLIKITLQGATSISFFCQWPHNRTIVISAIKKLENVVDCPNKPFDKTDNNFVDVLD